jgi:hypothetical protein
MDHPPAIREDRNTFGWHPYTFSAKSRLGSGGLCLGDRALAFGSVALPTFALGVPIHSPL